MPWLFRFALRHVVRTSECVQLPILDAADLDTRRQGTDLGFPEVLWTHRGGTIGEMRSRPLSER